MIKQPKYLVKFTNAYNDNGTVWYTVKVRLSPYRSSTPSRVKSGHSRKDIAGCGPSTRIVIRASGRMTCLISLQENYLEILVRSSFRNGRRNFRTTIAPSSGLSILMTCLKYLHSSTIISQSSLNPSQTKELTSLNTLLKKLRRKKKISKGYLMKSSSNTKRKWSKATSSTMILRMRPGVNSTSNSKN